MKKLFQIFVVITFLSVNLKMSAQEISVPKFGIGASLLSFNYFNRPSILSFPITFNNKFRLEPEVGFWTRGGSQGYSAGLGIYGLKPSSDLLFKYGVNGGIFAEDIYFLAPTVGGEYFLSKRFSIGAEAQLLTLYNGIDDFTLSTNSSLSVRFYF